ncbi:hypothetical protein GF312_00265 [Candidatus Poribacteria bacterium]|nr:hypothetical protein [Candidatus Poribacteria bacterium]
MTRARLVEEAVVKQFLVLLKKRGKIILPLFLFIVIIQPVIGSTSITGITGLINTPTAKIIPDGKASFGMGYTDKKYSIHGPEHAQLAYYVTIGYLPFLEGSLRITTFPSKEGQGATGSVKDRMASVKFRINKESRYIPAFLVGFHDVLGIYGHEDDHLESVFFNTSYAVASKSLPLWILGSWDFHIGYASEILIKNAGGHSMVGFFSGVEKHIKEYITFMGEYDTKRYNFGIRFTPFRDWLVMDVVFLGAKKISGGLSVSVNL